MGGGGGGVASGMMGRACGVTGVMRLEVDGVKLSSQHNFVFSTVSVNRMLTD